MTQEEFFNRYKYDRTKDRIGGGGFGNVYKVFDTIENETVALKIAEVKQGQESLSLLKEVELASSLKRHVNIARYTACYRFDLPNGHFDFGILQYYPLGNLSQLVKTKKLSNEEKEQIAKGIISGIQHLHNNNIVHRDLKSANILIAQGYQGEYVPKIADFGLSKQFAQNENSYFSNSFAGGSLLYVAPEQLEGKELRKNVDLWSMGVVLYELFVGETPFRANVDDGSETARAEIISKIRNATLQASITSVPSPWQEIIRVCLVTNPSSRIKSIDAVQYIVNGKTNTKKDSDRTEVDTKVVKEKKNEKKVKQNSASKSIFKWFYYVLGAVLLIVSTIMAIRSCGDVDISSDLVVYEEGNMYGYKDAKGAVVIPARYETASPFSGGRGKVSVSDSVYYINDLGSIVEVLKPIAEIMTEVPDTEDTNVSGVRSRIADKAAADVSEEKKAKEAKEGAERKEEELANTTTAKPFIKMISIPGRNFKLSETEITIGQYLAFCKATNSHWPNWLENENAYNIYTGSKGEYKKMGLTESDTNHPIIGISALDADAFCTWMGGRLPTQSEWEYAAKGGENYQFAGSNDVNEVAWYAINSGAKTHMVGKKMANGYGLFDMSGNVREWTSSKEGEDRVCRGGSYNIWAEFCTVSYISSFRPTLRIHYLGFRLASDI